MASLQSQLKKRKPINDKDCLMLQAQKSKQIHQKLLAYPKEIRDECDPDSPYLHHLNLPRRSISYKVDKKSARFDYYAERAGFKKNEQPLSGMGLVAIDFPGPSPDWLSKVK